MTSSFQLEVVCLLRTVVGKNTGNTTTTSSDSKRLCVDQSGVVVPPSVIPSSASSPLSKPVDDAPKEFDAAAVLETSFALERIFLITVDTTDERSSLFLSQTCERPNTCFLLEVRECLYD